MTTFDSNVACVKAQLSECYGLPPDVIASAIVNAVPPECRNRFAPKIVAASSPGIMSLATIVKRKAFEMVEYACALLPPEEQVKAIRRAIDFMKLDHEFWHIGLEALWRVGLNSEQFKDLCATVLDEEQYFWEAAVKVRLVLKRPDAKQPRSVFSKTGKLLKRTLDKTIFNYECEDGKRKIKLPTIYYPFKTAYQLNQLKKAKAEYIKPLGEEDGLIFPVPKTAVKSPPYGSVKIGRLLFSKKPTLPLKVTL